MNIMNMLVAVWSYKKCINEQPVCDVSCFLPFFPEQLEHLKQLWQRSCTEICASAFVCHGAAALGSGWWCWCRHRCYYSCYYSCYSISLISHNKMAEEPSSLYDFIHFSSCATKVAF